MIQLSAIYGHPTDPAAFDRHYTTTHGPLARQLPGCRGFTTNHPASTNPDEKSPYYLIANLYFDSLEAMAAAFDSDLGKKTVADLDNFVTGGITIVAGEVEVYTPVSIG